MQFSQLFFVPLLHETEDSDSRRNGNEIALSHCLGYRIQGGNLFV